MEKAIVESSATRTIVGSENWHCWLENYGSQQTEPISSRAVRRRFKFGGGKTLVSDSEVKFTGSDLACHGACCAITHFFCWPE